MRKVKGYFLFFWIFCGVTSCLAQTDEHLRRTQDVPAIEVQNGNQAELARILIAALQVESKTEERKMAYFELKSSLENKQIELIEAYFQLSQGAFGPKTAALKTGRFALLPFENRYFTSHATANALLDFRLTEANPIYPHSPFNVGKKPQRYFRFMLTDSVQTSSADTLIEIRFIPKQQDGTSFSGYAWLNPKTQELSQVSLTCRACIQQPFLPLFPSDSIQSIDFNILASYAPKKQGASMQHLKATYDISYLSRRPELDSAQLSYHSEANIQTYALGQAALLPHFYFEQGVDVYRKIMAFPYPAYFWKANPEPFPSAIQALQNEQFYQRATISNERIAKREIKHTRIFEHPYIPWSNNRVLLREEIPTAMGSGKVNMGDVAPLYKLEVQLFYDFIQSKDSLLFLSSCVIDPYLTYYHLSIDNTVNCFINMYFDLCEIERRKFETRCKAAHYEQTQVAAIYEETQLQLQQVLQAFLEEVDRGSRKKAMLKWNQIILDELGIDNMRLFAYE